MAGEIHPTRDRDEPTTACGAAHGHACRTGAGNGDVDLPEMPTAGPTVR